MREEEWRILSGNSNGTQCQYPPLSLLLCIYTHFSLIFLIQSRYCNLQYMYGGTYYHYITLQYIIIFYCTHIFTTQITFRCCSVLLQQFACFQKVTDKAPSIFFPGCFNMNTLCFSCITAIYHITIYRIICSLESHRQSLARTMIHCIVPAY